MISRAKEYIDKIKWVLPLLFFLGYFLTFQYFDDNSGEYLTYTLLAVASCVVFLSQVKSFEQKYVAVWFVFILLSLIYFLRFYWITIDPLPVRVMLPWNHYMTMVEPRFRVTLLQAFKLSVMAFASFSFSTAALLFIMRKQNNQVYQHPDNGNSTSFGLIAKQSLLVITPLILVLAYITYKYHIGEMGAPSGEVLPFRLKGIIFYARTILIPLIILLSIYLAERSGQIMVSRLGVLILIIHGIMDMMLRNSRSGLFVSLLLLVFLILIDGIKLRRIEKVFFGVMMMLAFFMVPIMTEYRHIRTNYNLPHIEAFFNALNGVGKDWLTQILKGLQFVFFRMPGIESLWCMIASQAQPLGIHSIDVINSKDGIAGYLTYVIYPLTKEDNNLLVPGFCGWFYLVAGLPAIVLGSLFTGSLSVLGWKFLDRRYLESGPVAQVFFLWMLFMVLTEGTLDSLVYMFLVGLITLIALEVGLRIYTRKETFKFTN